MSIIITIIITFISTNLLNYFFANTKTKIAIKNSIYELKDQYLKENQKLQAILKINDKLKLRNLSDLQIHRLQEILGI